MTEKPTSERPEIEQSEKMKKILQKMLSDIESGVAEDLIYPFSDYKYVGEKGFLINLTKTFFDQLFYELRAKLEAIKKGSKPHEINWIVGHEVGHSARVYGMIKDQIPESEADLRQRGEAILELYDVYRYSGFTEEEKKDFELYFEKVSERLGRLDEETRKTLAKQHTQKVMEEAERIVNLFSTPLLNEQEKQSAMEQMKATIQARLDSLG